MDGSAIVEGNCRFSLTREWMPARPRMLWLMCNPSTADHRQDDNTIRRCIRFAASHGCGSLEVVNLWPFKMTDPNLLWELLRKPPSQHELDLAHDRNVDHVCRAAQRASRRVMAFGVDPVKRYPAHVREVVDLVEHCGSLECLGTNDGGWPLHPLARGKLAITNDTRLRLWTWPQQGE